MRAGRGDMKTNHHHHAHWVHIVTGAVLPCLGRRRGDYQWWKRTARVVVKSTLVVGKDDGQGNKCCGAV